MSQTETLTDIHRRREPLTAWLGVVLLFLVFGLLVWVICAAMPRGDSYESKRAQGRAEKLKTARADFDKSLGTYGWVDKTKGVAHVPIDRAMELAMADLAQKKPAAAGPIAAPTPAVVAKDSGAATAAAAPSVTPAPAGASKPGAIVGPTSEIHSQNAAAANPTNAQPSTQPGAAASPGASPPAPSAQAPVKPNASPNATPVQSAAGTPLPVPGKTP